MTPKLRFKGFTEPWEQRKLGNVVDVQSGKDYKHLSEGNIPVYGTGGYMLSVNKALSYNQDAIGIGRKGTIDKPYVLKAPFWTVDTLFYAIPKDDNELDFLNCIFQNVDWKKKDESTGVPSLSKSTINNVDVFVPDKKEQKSIGEYFSKLDNLITLHQREVDALTNIKNGLMQKIFSQEIRFKADDGSEFPEWENIKFSSIYKQVNEKNDGSFGTDKIISVANMYFKTDATIGKEDYLKSYNVCRVGDIAFEGNKSKKFSFGRLVENDVGDGIVSHVFIVFRPVISGYNLVYWKYAINYEPIMGKILAKCTKKSTMMTDLVPSDFLKQEVLVPCLEEQQKIADCLLAMDEKIASAQKELETLKIIKKGFLQQMFV